MTKTEQDELLLNSLVAAVRVRCIWRGDRFAHSIQWSDGSQWLELLTSQEGTSAEPWPPSPPIQEFHRQAWQTTDCLLGIGKAGAGHWSLSLEPLSNCAGFRFDVACRLDSQAPGVRLGACYAATTDPVMANLEPAGQGDGETPGLANGLPNPTRHRWRLTQEGLPAVQLVAVSGGEWRVAEQRKETQAAAVCEFNTKVPDLVGQQTARWLYEIHVDVS